MRATLKNLLLFLILNSACASKPVVTSFDGKWEIVETRPDEPPKACLGLQDVMKLRETLIRCEGK